MHTAEKYHSELLTTIKTHAKTPQRGKDSIAYHGGGHTHYLLNNPTMRQIAKDWTQKHKDITLNVLTELVTSLFQAPSYEEKTIGPKILEYLPHQRSELDPNLLNTWLNSLEGWAEIDSLCQSTFSHKDILSKWNLWKRLIERFSQDSNISKRRASLVLLTGVVSHTQNQEPANLALNTIDNLKHEKPILITKAISWLLRSMVRYHRQKVEKYVIMHKETLPKIAVRETERKLKTGKK